ncbi:SPOR domain-containing protein [Sphingomonas koreensis]|nr:SPOR domain-containing protein [Sphingomonas koreensis]
MATSGDDMRDEDRLPWLETVDADYEDGPSPWRLIGLVVVGLALIAALVYAVFWIKQHHHSEGGNGALIAAQEGDYKVKPDEAGGMKADGEGAAALATSQGADKGNAAIDLSAVPEAPIAGKPAASQPGTSTAGTSSATTEVPASGGALRARPPVSAPKTMAAAAANGSVVQLGAYPDQATANSHWKQLAGRFAYLAPLGQSIEPATVGSGTVYRLRVNAGSAQAASQLCGKLKVAGEDCFVP